MAPSDPSPFRKAQDMQRRRDSSLQDKRLFRRFHVPRRLGHPPEARAKRPWSNEATMMLSNQPRAPFCLLFAGLRIGTQWAGAAGIFDRGDLALLSASRQRCWIRIAPVAVAGHAGDFRDSAELFQAGNPLGKLLHCFAQFGQQLSCIDYPQRGGLRIAPGPGPTDLAFQASFRLCEETARIACRHPLSWFACKPLPGGGSGK